jgi:hypothetical protein
LNRILHCPHPAVAMKTSRFQSVPLPIALLITSVALLSACTSPTAKAPVRTGSLTTYHNLEQVDESTWRYINRDRLGSYNKFIVQPVKIVAADYEGRPISEEARRAASEYMREAVVKAISDRYPVVTSASLDTAEVVIYITESYKSGVQLGLTVEGEIRDSYSGVQVASVVKSELGDRYLGQWWNDTSARQIMDEWAARIRQVLDEAHQTHSARALNRTSAGD